MNEDITIEELARRDTVLSTVMDSLFDGVYITDNARRIVFWNRGAEAITGYSAEEVVGRFCHDAVLDHVDGENCPLCRDRCPIVRCLATGENVREKVYPRHKSGRRFPVVTHISALRAPGSGIVAAVEVFRDVSAEEALETLQKKFDELMQSFVSKSTYERVLAQARSGDAASAELGDLTVFYLDVAGFTAFSETNGPLAAVRLLNDVFGMCGLITREHRGDIDKFIGDAIVAVFQDPEDAVRAALRIAHEALPALNAARLREGLPPVRVRMGVHSGQVVQGVIGTGDRKDLTVIGDVVNLASRLESLCTPGEVVVSDACHARLSPGLRDRFVARGSVSVKGRVTPAEIYESRREGGGAPA